MAPANHDDDLDDRVGEHDSFRQYKFMAPLTKMSKENKSQNLAHCDDYGSGVGRCLVSSRLQSVNLTAAQNT
jgi:hypothetical protein